MIDEKQIIKPASLEMLAESAKNVEEQLIDIFVNEAPKRMMERQFSHLKDDQDSYSANKIKESVLEFVKNLQERLLAEIPVTVASLCTIRQIFPTRFRYELIIAVLTASEKIKREFIGKFDPTFIENDIESTRKEVMEWIGIEFKDLIMHDYFIKEGRFDDALAVVKSIELQREASNDALLKIEVSNLKTNLALKKGDCDLYFEALNQGLSLHGKETVYFHPDMFKSSIEILLSISIPEGIKIKLSGEGQAWFMKEGVGFVHKQAELFTSVLIRKITEGICKTREIKTGDDFRSMLSGPKFDDIVSGFKQLNPFIEKIVL